VRVRMSRPRRRSSRETNSGLPGRRRLMTD
jgi:hypothetical protein